MVVTAAAIRVWADSRIFMLISKCTTTSKSMQASMFSFYIQYWSIITVISGRTSLSLSLYKYIYTQQNNHQICFTTYRMVMDWVLPVDPVQQYHLVQAATLKWTKEGLLLVSHQNAPTMSAKASVIPRTVFDFIFGVDVQEWAIFVAALTCKIKATSKELH